MKPKPPVKPAKLGMTVQPPTPKKPTPYDELADRMMEGTEEEKRLERQGLKRTSGYQERSQKKIPKVNPKGPGNTQA